MNHRAWFPALAAGAVVGLVLGLVYAWLVAPVELYNTTPALLRSDYRHEWVRLAALGYVADGDLERALARLEGVPPEDVQAALAALIEAYAVQGRPAETMRALSHLADRLGVYTPAMAVYLGPPLPSPTAPPPSPTPPPQPTTPPPTPTPTTAPFISPLPSPSSPLPTPIPSPYRVISQTLVCEGPEAQLQVLVRAAPGEDGEEGPPLTGVVLWLTWPGGADRAVTGLRPWIDPGYADFTLLPDLPYALSIGEPNAPVLSGLTAQPCPGGSRTGSWRVVVEVAP